MSVCKYYVKEDGGCRKFTDLSNPMNHIEYCVKSPCPYEKPLTNYEHIKSMSVDEFAEWISKHSYSAWLEWFDKKYCKNCPDIMCKYEDGLTEFPCSYCEINDKCKFFLEKESVPNGKEIIKMWLEDEFLSVSK